MTEFALWKVLHVLGATVLLGTGGGIGFFCWFGYRGALRHAELAALRAVLRLTVFFGDFVSGLRSVYRRSLPCSRLSISWWPSRWR